MTKQQASRGYAIFEWLNDHIKAVSIVAVVVALALGFLGPIVADESEPNFSPGGEIYDTEDLVEDRFASDSPVRAAVYLIENR
ncbi:MAG: hypothetical protein OEM94_09520, partial [Acidimicrobiia bacterium]|nr:hypothetical protein [Acidimicrobiia bacterium]